MRRLVFHQLGDPRLDARFVAVKLRLDQYQKKSVHSLIITNLGK